MKEIYNIDKLEIGKIYKFIYNKGWYIQKFIGQKNNKYVPESKYFFLVLDSSSTYNIGKEMSCSKRNDYTRKMYELTRDEYIMEML